MNLENVGSLRKKEKKKKKEGRESETEVQTRPSGHGRFSSLKRVPYSFTHS